MTVEQAPRTYVRREHIDWARGIAVLLMIEAHALDAWTAPAARHGVLFRDLTILGGFAAPLFLWLAGLSLSLSAERSHAVSASRAAAVETICRRGLEIFILAFLFRFQAFVVSPGSHPIALFRVDILNIMGPAMAAAALLWATGSTPSRRALVLVFSGALCSALTPLVRSAAWIDRLPLWVQWYLRPAGEHTTFTLFPWAGFLLIGAGCGVWIARTSISSERRLQGWMATLGAVLLATGWFMSNQPSIYRDSSFWTSSPSWFVMRAGVILLACGVLYAIARTVRCQPLARLGRSSLFVYWIHVELVYGYATWVIHHRLPVAGTLAALLMFSALMYGSVLMRDWITDLWKARRLVEYPKPVLP